MGSSATSIRFIENW